MRKKILSVILIIGITASLAACGSGGTEKKKEKSEMETVSAETGKNEAGMIVETEETVELVSGDNEVAETSYSAEDFEEQKDIFVYKHIDSGDGTQIDFANEEQIDGPFILSESIDIYSYFFTYAGYTKPNIKVDIIRRIGDWIFVPFAKSSFLVKAEDFDRVAVLKEKTENTINEDNANAETESASTGQKKTPSQNEGNANMANEVLPAPEAEAKPTAPAPEVTTYSEEEVISIVEGALRDAGFRKPEEKMTADELAMFGPTAGMGWGIDNIPMNDPHTAASQIVEGFQFAGWTTYYIENQGSSDGYVHLKLYSGS